MKSVLGCLMCLVFTVSQSYALSGGPFGGTTQVNVVGTYAGVFVPAIVTVVLSPGPPPVTETLQPGNNSIGLFTLSVPTTGLATGTSVVFFRGLFYPGTIQGSADPDTAKLTAILNASFTLTVASVNTATNPPTTTTFTFTYTANGEFNNTRIVADTNLFTATSERVKGKASVTFLDNADDPNGDSGGPIGYHVIGFKQSNSSSG